MALKIRLKRVGSKGKPSYRVVVANAKSPRNGKTVAQIGQYNPMFQPAVIKIDVDSAKKWLRNGAQPTDIVRILFKKLDIN
jgi:small subunit ribosomal protein S16